MSKEYVYADDARWLDGTIPQIPEICADVFGSSVRPRLIELCISKNDLLIPGTARIKRRPIATKASKDRLSDCRRRPPVARCDRQGLADVILWRQFRSGIVIIVVEVERGLGTSCFVPC